ncbi:uncharacterized protein MKZ38_002098 [Zalerion maritima]|uniref:Uncharacterized protein n=1 Tax=Zalerion maritima TaxID=339359 RepID=A0AAD5RPF9_9PEZI|nr:uncharacterized protein MKZ38_002098 [Zalerion maritima]
MSPIVTRTVPRIATRVVQRRQASTMAGMRRWAQSFEPHPFERIPVSTNAQAGDYAKMFKRSASAFAFYVPGLAIILGWPYLGAQLLQGHVSFTINHNNHAFTGTYSDAKRHEPNHCHRK